MTDPYIESVTSSSSVSRCRTDAELSSTVLALPLLLQRPRGVELKDRVEPSTRQGAICRTKASFTQPEHAQHVIDSVLMRRIN